ncbi:MAG: hypothetical protein HY360_20085 [Verrucomicrobia bacterium]|nr:hypothetical protein [Verrucomicrobiota bacterium]
MTVILPTTRQSVYQLSEALREEAIPVAIRRATPSEADREELVLQRMGVRAWGRLHQFRHYYSQGWGESGGKPLSPRALESFYRFLENGRFPEGATPSLFLTDEGCLELCWEDAEGKAIQVEFTSSGAEYFVEAKGIEDRANFSELPNLARRLLST